MDCYRLIGTLTFVAAVLVFVPPGTNKCCPLNSGKDEKIGLIERRVFLQTLQQSCAEEDFTFQQ